MNRRTVLRSLLAAAVLGGLMMTAAAYAQEVTLKGTLQCAKCSLKEADKCANVLTVKEGDKDVNYYFVDNDVSKAAHEGICKKPKADTSVTGSVMDKDGKKWITATKID